MRVNDGARLSPAIPRRANRHLGKLEFLREVSDNLMEYRDRDLHCRREATRRPQAGSRFERVRWSVGRDGHVISAGQPDSDLGPVCQCVAPRPFGADQALFTRNGRFWRAGRAPTQRAGQERRPRPDHIRQRRDTGCGRRAGSSDRLMSVDYRGSC
jgi:hypothetical protein